MPAPQWTEQLVLLKYNAEGRRDVTNLLHLVLLSSLPHATVQGQEQDTGADNISRPLYVFAGKGRRFACKIFLASQNIKKGQYWMH